MTTLYDLNAFGKNEEFDPSKALLITNCIFAVLQYGGHHSYIELVEPYNRLLDAVCIACENKKEQVEIFRESQIPLVQAGNKEHLENFIHHSIRDNVVSKMEELIKIKLASEEDKQVQNTTTSSMAAHPKPRDKILGEASKTLKELAIRDTDAPEKKSSSSSSGSRLQKIKDPNEDVQIGSEPSISSPNSSSQRKRSS